ncbi:hypothetical protein ET272_24465 [Salmonella enterica]|uniref:Uncharacterized protein n=1 Tax=Salmonella enterica TaxID=28901 RepID=A0A3J3C9Z0_SALER|nr:hypothetical protein [Salmonella enterica]ECU4770265.1 hypothetical protein [Salmonella enterica subsp. enterica]EAN2271241.1 hypothetical protein [Salmonella enterica]EAN4086691.1 hypothetical protein [Salmonella enterica]EAN4460817.1 hypothetical protein [Salmonella enterica]
MCYLVNFHDSKAKGISDYEGSSRDKQLFPGDIMESQGLIYDKKLKIMPPPDGATFNRKSVEFFCYFFAKYSNRGKTKGLALS